MEVKKMFFFAHSSTPSPKSYPHYPQDAVDK